MTRVVCAVLLSIIGIVAPAAAQAGLERAGEPQVTQVGVPSGDQVSLAAETTPGVVVLKVTGGCDSKVNIVYEQRNTIARVEGSIASSSCPASRGEYTAVVNFRDVNGESKTLEFVESWERNDDQAIGFINDYEIGENVDLTRVRLRRLRCTCIDAPAE